MSIPDELQQSIYHLFNDRSQRDDLIKRSNGRDCDQSTIQQLKKASIQLSKRYLEGESLTAKFELLAYLIVRFPATYAVLHRVLSQLPEAGTFLDLGAGPGTASFVIQTLWNLSPTKITSIEKEDFFIQLGKQLKAPTEWEQKVLSPKTEFLKQDWALFSYSLGELPEKNRELLLKHIWEDVTKGLIIIEPGTPRGYHHVIAARTLLLQLGGNVFAPCPHSNRCPLEQNDWCHFSVRLQRSYLHRQVKNCQLPYEDEKYSYLIMTKQPYKEGQSRVIRPPLHHSGHTLLSLCTKKQLEKATITKSHKERYKQARKIEWGDLWQE